VQVDSIKTRESAPGFRVWDTRLKPKCDEPLSNFAFNYFILRRYSWVPGLHDAELAALVAGLNLPLRGGAVQADSIKSRVESAPGFSA